MMTNRSEDVIFSPEKESQRKNGSRKGKRKRYETGDKRAQRGKRKRAKETIPGTEQEKEGS